MAAQETEAVVGTSARNSHRAKRIVKLNGTPQDLMELARDNEEFPTWLINALTSRSKRIWKWVEQLVLQTAESRLLFVVAGALARWRSSRSFICSDTPRLF